MRRLYSHLFTGATETGVQVTNMLITLHYLITTLNGCMQEESVDKLRRLQGILDSKIELRQCDQEHQEPPESEVHRVPANPKTVRQKVKLTATPKKAETVTGRRPWTLDDDRTDFV